MNYSDLKIALQVADIPFPKFTEDDRVTGRVDGKFTFTYLLTDPSRTDPGQPVKLVVDITCDAVIRSSIDQYGITNSYDIQCDADYLHVRVSQPIYNNHRLIREEELVNRLIEDIDLMDWFDEDKNDDLEFSFYEEIN